MKIKPISRWLFDHRHPIFLSSMLFFFIIPELINAIFGVELQFFLLFSLVILSSILLVQTHRHRKIVTALLLVFAVLVSVYINFYRMGRASGLGIYFLLFIYFSWVTVYLFRDLLRTKEITAQIVLGAFAGYFLLGVLGFFCFAFLEVAYPESLSLEISSVNDVEQVLYFSFVTLTTIGYGDILPTSLFTQKLAILMGLIGQFYIAIVMAIMVGKFLSRRSRDE